MKRHFMSQVLLLLVISISAADNVRSADAAELPEKMRCVIEKTQSFGLGRYPIGFWAGRLNLAEHGRHINEAEVESWADAGFTVPRSPSYNPKDAKQKAHILRLLDWAHARRMKLILWDPRCHATLALADRQELIPSSYADGMRAAVKDFGAHPATFGFFVCDEPNAENKDASFACHRVQKEIAPHLHPLLNLMPYFPGSEVRTTGGATWPNYLDEYVKKSNADLISYDCYAQMKPGQEGWNNYYENLRVYREASLRNGVPFWNTVLSVGHFDYRCPNLDDIRWHFNTTLASGAHGLIWYFYYMCQPRCNYRLSPVDEHWDRTETYYNIRRVQKSFHRLYGDLFTRIVSTRVTFYPEPFGGGKKFSPNGIVSRVSTTPANHPILLGEFADIQGRRYLMVVNNSMPDSVRVCITCPGQDVRIFSGNWSGAEREGPAYSSAHCWMRTRDKNGLTEPHWLAPGQEAMYRVQSESAAKEPISGSSN